MKRKSVRIYSFTGTGSCLALKLAEKLKQEGYVCTGYTVARFAEDKRLQRLNDGWKQEIGASWGEHALVFIGAAEETLSRLKEKGCLLYGTQEYGAVTLKIKGEKATIETFCKT